jgi:integrase
LGKVCLYIWHSWNFRDGLKTTKNNKDRTVEVPFPSLIDCLLKLAGRNPHGVGMDSYVFWAEKSSSKPMNGVLFTNGLRDALVKTGMSREDSAVYVFHGWRHYFTSYMTGRVNEKLLQKQTGHKTPAMVKHYGDHLLDGDRERIRQAQKDVFGALIPIGPSLLNWQN